MSSEKSKGLAIGAAIGAVAGVLTGILFAPKSGKETRQDIKDASNKAVTKVLEEAKKLQNDLGALIDKVETAIKDKKGAATKKVNDLIEQAKDAQLHLRVVAKAFKQGGADDKDLDRAVKKAKEAKKALETYLKK